MQKYYELTVELMENGWAKQLVKKEFTETVNNVEVSHDEPYLDDFIYMNGSPQTLSITILKKSKLDTYYEQAKVLIIENLQQERDRINKLLEVGE
jgi:hypothetical protein